jgi:hypothetical protein
MTPAMKNHEYNVGTKERTTPNAAVVNILTTEAILKPPSRHHDVNILNPPYQAVSLLAKAMFSSCPPDRIHIELLSMRKQLVFLFLSV